MVAMDTYLRVAMGAMGRHLLEAGSNTSPVFR